jgi:hypothetical protein
VLLPDNHQSVPVGVRDPAGTTLAYCLLKHIQNYEKLYSPIDASKPCSSGINHG